MIVYDGWFFSPVKLGMFAYIKAGTGAGKFRYWNGSAWAQPDVGP